MRPVPLEEFAALVRCEPEKCEQYRAAGLLDPDADGLFDGLDVVRIHLARVWGEPEEALAAVRELESPLAQRLFGMGGPYTGADLAGVLGIDQDRIEATGRAAGLPQRMLDAEDLQGLTAMKEMLDAGLPWEALEEGARVYGDAIGRLTQAEMRMVHRYLCEPMAKAGANEEQISTLIYEALIMIERAADRLINHMVSDLRLRAWVEHVLSHLEQAPDDRPPGSLDRAIVFCDLALFSSLTEEHGDEAAARVLDAFDRRVRELAVEHEGTLVKQIGDEFMLVFSRPANAVAFAVELRDKAESDVRIGVHAGPVLYRVGDYVGSTVNVASRVTSMAMPGTILLTEPVARTAGVPVEELGLRRMRGVGEPIPIFRVAGTAQRDPVCGAEVGTDAAARLQHEGAEVVFCSQDCLRKFLATV